MPQIDRRSRQTEDAQSEVKATYISDNKSGYLSYILLVMGLHDVYRKLTKTLWRVWSPPGRNPFWTSWRVFSDQTILSFIVLSRQSLSHWWVRGINHLSLPWSVWIILLRFGFPTCSMAALSIIGQSVGDFQLMLWLWAESCFEGLYSWPFSFCLSAATINCLGREDAAISRHVGMWRSGVRTS